MHPAAEPDASRAAASAAPSATPDRRLAFEGRALGSVLRLHVRPPDPPDRPADEAGMPVDISGTARVAWSAVLAEFDAVDLALSKFRSDSELTALNALAGTGVTVPVSRRLRTAIAAVHRAGRLTDGLFDARVLDVLERLGEHAAPLSSVRRGPPAAENGLHRWPVVVPDAPLDMGGIGKGLALRWAAGSALDALPRGSGLLLEAGGDLVAVGTAPAGGWPVGIEDPVAEPGHDAGPIAVVALTGGAVATSSIRVRRWVAPDGRPVHHLVDPRTREPARTGLIAVTVAGPDPAWAEVWSKALFLAGRSTIAHRARVRDLAAWWIDDRGALGMTPAARTRSAWVAEERLGSS